MKYRILGDITDIELIARGTSVRVRQYLNEMFGRGPWRKLKGRAIVEYDDAKSG